MPEDMPFCGDPDDSREAIMCATYRALNEHGFAGLSIQRIANEADLSKSTFYHHFDDKDDLIASFVEFMLEQFVRVFSLESGDDPRENLRTFIDILVLEEPDVDDEFGGEAEAVLGTYVELRAQAVRDGTVREQFTATDQAFTAQLVDIIHSGIEADVFRPVDVDATAAFIATVIAGNTFQRTTSEAYSPDVVRAELDGYVQRHLLA